MKKLPLYALIVAFIVASTFVLVTSVLGWKAFSANLPAEWNWLNNRYYIPIVAWMIVMTFPFHIMHFKEFSGWKFPEQLGKKPN